MNNMHSRLLITPMLLVILTIIAFSTIYTSCDNELVFKDTILEKYIRESVNKAEGQITQDDLDKVTSLYLSNKQLSNISGISKLRNLEDIYFDGSNILNYSELTCLTKLKYICIENYKGTNIEFLNSLPQLKTLIIYNNNIKSISTLKSLKNLKSLALCNSKQLKTEDFTVIQNLVNLEYLSIYNNNISSINFLNNLAGIKTLDISNNKISDITPLSSLKNLEVLNASKNKIVSITPLKSLGAINRLWLGNNQIKNIEGIGSLKELTSLSLDNNQISNTSVLSLLTNLKELYLTNNKITNIQPLSNLAKLARLTLKGNNISDFSPIKSYDYLLDYKDFEQCIQMIINGKEMDLKQYPYISNNKIYVPLKPVLTGLGVNYSLDETLLSINNVSVANYIDYIKNKDIINNSEKVKDSDSYYVSLDLLNKLLNIESYWDIDSRVVYLLDKSHSGNNTEMKNNSFFGNTIGNAQNGGFIASQGDWIYYLNTQYKLIKYNTKTRERFVLYRGLKLRYSGLHAQYFNLLGDWLYLSDNRYLYKIRTNGTLLQRIKTYNESIYNLGSMILKDKYVFYNQSSDPLCLYKISLDDGKIAKQEAFVAYYFDVDNENIYFTSTDNIMKINYETGEKKWLYKPGYIDNLFKVDDSLYFNNSNCIEKINLNTNKVEYVLDPACDIVSCNYYDRWIYYTYKDNNKEKEYICKVSLDGNSNITIAEMKKEFKANISGPEDNICIANDFIFYRLNNILHMVKIDGTEKQILD